MRNAEEIHHRSPIIHHIHISSLELRVKKTDKETTSNQTNMEHLKTNKKIFCYTGKSGEIRSSTIPYHFIKFQ